jgi:hypothetical protein
MTLKFIGNIFLALTFFILTSPLYAKEDLPETTKDGLVLQHQDKLGAVYLKPGATLADYTKVKLLECYVAFQKDWQRDYNDEQMGLTGQVTNQEMQSMKTKLATGFQEVFTKELDKAGYTVVDTTGADVLLIRPAIINLTVTAPDVMTAGMTNTYVSSAGSMTLYAELYDSLTSDKFAEVIDAEEVGAHGFNFRANSVTNRAEFEQALQAWAELLVKRLDEAHGKTKK